MPDREWWTEQAEKALVGQKIAHVSYEKIIDGETFGVVITLESGKRLLISQDDEGNGPGAVFIEGFPGDIDVLPVIREYHRRVR